VVTCQLKSKLLTFPGGRFNTSDEGERARFGAYALNRRAAEAVTVRAAATRLLGADGPPAAVVVLGDLNDGPEAATTQILYVPPGSQLGTDGYQRPDGGDRQRLWNLAGRIPPDQRFSRMHHGERELIDHILVSHALIAHIGDGDVTTGPGPTPSITDNPTARRDAPASDHRPLIATITL
jgi:endonuclease/exonuclease/phosphatase family metal-dependent hydrolase